MPNLPTAEALNDQGVAWLRQGRPHEARACWEEALRIQPMPEVHNNLGFLYAAQGWFDQAIACYRQALAFNPRYPEALNNLGIAEFQAGNPDAAIESFKAALAERPNYAEALNNLGSALLALRRPGEAADSYRRALAVQPENAETHSNLGVACKDLGLADEAIASWRTSLSLNPHDARTHRNLGVFLNQTGDRVGARRCYERVLELVPDDAEARFVLAALTEGARPARMPAEYVANLFDSYATTFDRHLVEQLAYRGPEVLKAALGSMAERSLDILDLGCGTGLCGVVFRDCAKRLVGVDLSANMLQAALARGVYDELVQGDLRAALAQAKASYDLVLAGDVLIYVGDLTSLFNVVHAAVRPGGRFAFTVETVEGADYRLLSGLRFVHSAAYIRRVAAQAGFSVVAMNPIIIRTEDGLPLAGLTVVLAK